VSVPARGLRFVLVALLAEFIAREALPRHSLPVRRAILAAAWVAFYAFYFSTMTG
jgi:hypothetical protein